MRLFCSLVVGVMVVAATCAATGKVSNPVVRPLVTGEKAVGEKAAVEEVDYKKRMREMSKRMNAQRRNLGTARVTLRRKRSELEKKVPACKALAEEIENLKKEIGAKEKALESTLTGDEAYAQLADAVKKAEAALDAARKELYNFVQEQKLKKKTQAEMEKKPSVPQQ